MLFISFFGVSPAKAHEPVSSNSAMLTKCSSEELANLYRQAGYWGDVQLKRRIAGEIGGGLAHVDRNQKRELGFFLVFSL